MTNTIKTNWKTTDFRFVAFLDILGFKDSIIVIFPKNRNV